MPRFRHTPPGVGSAEELVRALIERSRGGTRPSNLEIEEALEQGATNLVTLEANLQSVNAKLAAAPDPQAELGRKQLMEQITSLHDALKELRSCAEASAPSPLAHGFVLDKRSLKQNE